jgi:hypothetical protein
MQFDTEKQKEEQQLKKSRCNELADQIHDQKKRKRGNCNDESVTPYIDGTVSDIRPSPREYARSSGDKTTMSRVGWFMMSVLQTECNPKFPTLVGQKLGMAKTKADLNHEDPSRASIGSCGFRNTAMELCGYRERIIVFEFGDTGDAKDRPASYTSLLP